MCLCIVHTHCTVSCLIYFHMLEAAHLIVHSSMCVYVCMCVCVCLCACVWMCLHPGAVSLGSDYGTWCRVTVCRLSCTAVLILSINNSAPHCHPGPHLLITICHLSNAPPSLSHTISLPPSILPAVCPVILWAPPLPSPETWSSILRNVRSLHFCLSLSFFGGAAFIFFEDSQD